jgi:hypothetical protein
MNGSLRLPINLATRPLKNRRLFRTAVGVLIVLFLVLGGGAGALLLRSSVRRQADDKAAADLELHIQAVGKERAEKTGQSEAMKKRDSDLVSEVNGVIARKNFSWVDFFSRLEQALPPQCLIAAVNPLPLSGTSLHVAMKVITPDLSELLVLIENLTARKFKDVTMRNELTGGGRLISEIGFVYDGSH